jgi:predicted transcriptional regulator
MQDQPQTRRKLILDGDIEDQEYLNVLKALDSLNRLRILRYLWDKVASISDIATALDIPASTVALHVETLEEAGLIRTGLEPASRGIQKVCIRMFDRIEVNLPSFDQPREQTLEIHIPIGSYTAFETQPTCGLASAKGIIGVIDDPISFFELNRAEAQLIWFKQGYLEYQIPNRLPSGVIPETLRLSMEICSEAPHYDLNWPSDITLWVNGVEVGTWTSPADFGGEQGRLTPEWWPLHYCQYGLLKEWYVNEREAGIDGRRISGTKIAELRLQEARVISIKLGVKADAKNVGGLNLFGSEFGNHAQDINLWLSYRRVE